MDGVPYVFVIRGTRAWKAWEAYRRLIGRPINYYYQGDGVYKGKSGKHFPSLFPPGYTGLIDPEDSDEAWAARNPAQNASE